MSNGRIGAVIHFDSNPVYHLPDDLGYAEALKKVKTVVTLAELENESSYLSKYVLPINHPLESWGDAKTRTGFYSMQQPVISPILDTRQKEAVLLSWIESDSFEHKENLYHEYLKTNWQENIYPSIRSGLAFDQFWFASLHDGVVRVNETPSFVGSFNTAMLSELNLSNDVSGFAGALKESYQVGDGRYANNGWLQELPHPVTKVTWDNYAAISAATAKELDVDYNDFVEIEIDNRKIKIPVFIQPGAADKTITIELGYGRNYTGTIANGAGFNANKLPCGHSVDFLAPGDRSASPLGDAIDPAWSRRISPVDCSRCAHTRLSESLALSEFDYR
jgi:molybdopterin-containing oxidoreductase family iron-sulfur binding subunit